MNFPKIISNTLVILLLSLMGCTQSIKTGAEQPANYLSQLKDEKVAVVANQTSMVRSIHLVDFLLKSKVDVKKVFAPEHGFRGKHDAGEKVSSGIDVKTGLPIISLYGKHKKPTKKDLYGIDVVVFDIQDVGVRFYTYLSTLHYIMEACAENGVKVLLLDRPNPNIRFVDGPVLEKEHQSFVGLHPIPVLHGMTLGELAQMINREGWLKNSLKCELEIIPCQNYTRDSLYSLPVKPSPNLPNDQAVALYPSLCLFEGTMVSVGRGTGFPFQVFGAPGYKGTFEFSFVPQSNEGAKYPKYSGETCYGEDLRSFSVDSLHGINLGWLLEGYKTYPNPSKFFNSFFTKLVGVFSLQMQIESGMNEKKIKESWKENIELFKEKRQPYLLYK